MSKSPVRFFEVATTLCKPLIAMIDAVYDAGFVARRYFGMSPSDLRVSLKEDQSLLTIADTEIQKKLIHSLRVRLGGKLDGLAFLAEEKRRFPTKPHSRNVILIDPIDGTKQFASAHPDYAIAVAHAENTQQGLVVRSTVSLQPELKVWTLSNDEGTFVYDAKRYHDVRQSHLSKGDPTGIINLWGDVKDDVDGQVVSEMMYLLGKKGYQVRMAGSCVLAHAGVAVGQYDGSIIYSGRSLYAHPWDVASTHQIKQAGGIVTTMLGQPDPLNNDPHSVVSARDAQTHTDLLECVAGAMDRVCVSQIPSRKLLDRFPSLVY